MSFGLLVLVILLAILVALALYQRQDFGPAVKRFIEQFGMLVPRMLCALVAAIASPLDELDKLVAVCLAVVSVSC